jgi:hypothetical protein
MFQPRPSQEANPSFITLTLAVASARATLSAL